MACHYYPVYAARLVIIRVEASEETGIRSARWLYPRLCTDLVTEDIASLRVRFRDPHDLSEAVYVVVVSCAYLREKGIDTIALVGHSLDGAVVIQAAAALPTVRTVVVLTTQCYGAEPASTLGPRCSILLIHGAADTVPPAYSSQCVHEITQEPERLIPFSEASHELHEVADDVYATLHQWLITQLRGLSLSHLY